MVIEARPEAIRLARYSVPKVGLEDWWRKASVGIDESVVRAAAAQEGDERTSAVPAPGALFCDPAGTWDNGLLDVLPDPRSGHTAVWSGTEMIVWGGSDEVYSFATGGRYDPATDTWRATSRLNAPLARYGHSAVWTGREMIIWGGAHKRNWPPEAFAILADGARYDPLTDTWTPISTVGAPIPRSGHSSVWTGKAMIVWGGSNWDAGGYLNTGGRYDPSTDTWTPVSTLGAPPPGYYRPAAVWTGSEMIVLSGDGGARYNPATDTWTPVSTLGAPPSSYYSAAVWTGSEMIVFSGGGGARYNPATDTWTPISTVDAPPWFGAPPVWTGTEMIVFGNCRVHLYDPETDTWRLASACWGGRPELNATAVWTGTSMVVWGGTDGGGSRINRGAGYSPVNDNWTPISTMQAPRTPWGSAVWAGVSMITWGGWDTPTGTDRYDPVIDTWSPVHAPIAGTTVWTGQEIIWWDGWSATGGRYDPLTDLWWPIATEGNPGPPSYSQCWPYEPCLGPALWTGSEAIFWGENGGGRYDPAADAWRSVSTLDSPGSGLAVWAGSEMIVFSVGGGARYNPATDAWTPISTVGAPPIAAAAVVWTGREMIVWCGTGNYGSAINIGARYDPSTDAWTPASTVGAPFPRTKTAAVWTGQEMVIWGGGTSSGFDSGGRYDPVHDTWTEVSATNAPVGRTGHAAVWTGTAMIVWGGQVYPNNQSPLNTGGRYVLGPIMDNDDDGFTECQGDCDDADPAVHPGASEVCDGIDNDCDGVTDNGGDALCDDGDVCTEDTCNGTTGCGHVFRDAIPPTIICPTAVTVECQANLQSAVVLPPATASDVCQPSDLAITNTYTPNGANASSSYPLGTTTVAFTATDAAGNQSSCQTAVTVRDTIPPVLTVVPSPSVLWPPNHRMSTVNNTVVATDICDPNPSIILTAVVSNEPDDAQGGGDGQTTDDIQGTSIGTPDFQILLRAERDGQGSGRVYTMTYRASDISGNAANASSMVTVPHDMTDMAVEPLNLIMSGRTDTTAIWGPVEGAQYYDVIRGDLANLRVNGSNIDLVQVVCIEHATTSTTTVGYEDTAVPASGHVFFYAVQYFNGIENSSYGSESAGRARVIQPGDGDCQ